MLDFGNGWRQFVKWAMIAVMIFAAVLLASQHLQHLFGILPLMLLFACPLMHLFGHGHHHHGNDSRSTAQAPEHGEAASHG